MDLEPISKPSNALTKNPLGIIALFIFLIYSIASIVLGVSSEALTESQKWFFVVFLVSFPPIVLAAFVWLVAKHAVKLYSPSDFRDDQSYIELNQKIHFVEIKQRAGQVDPRGSLDEARAVLAELLSIKAIDTAKGLANAFLKVRRYRDSLSLFEDIANELRRVGKNNNALLSHRAYCFIGMEDFQKARHLLMRLQSASPELFDFWPTVALAYCLLRDGEETEAEILLAAASQDPAAKSYASQLSVFYPDMSERFKNKLNAENDRVDP